jgi:long-chain acyl-CoA synthetase
MRAPGDVRTLVDVFEASAARHASRELFGTKLGGKWVYATYGQVKKLVDNLRGGLSSLGVAHGDRVAIIANNRIEWPVAAYATQGLGAAFVPMYESQLERDWEYIVRDSGCKLLIVPNSAVYQRVLSFARGVATLSNVVVLSNEPGELGYRALLDRGADHPVPIQTVDPGDMACLLYTSGTTGDPKGVVLTHENVVSNVIAVRDCLPIDETDRSLAFLPWAHSFGYTAELNVLVSLGASLAICEGNDKIVANLAEVKPTIVLAVPRVFNRIYANVEKQVQSKAKPLRVLFRRGLALSVIRRRGGRLTRIEQGTLALADRLIFAKVRARFGGRLRYAISGSAALSKDVGEFVDGLGITVYEGYGLTETSPIVAVNVPDHTKMGTVGRPIRGVRVVIDRTATGDPKSGEIVVYGPNVMKGYYNRPEETKAVLTDDGGFRTGDMGYLDDEGYLCITGRIKEQYKLENGKYVAPAPLEEALKLSPFIANVMIHGENRPHNVALIVPEMATLSEWVHERGIADGTHDGLLSDERVRSKIAEEIEKHSRDWKSYERIRHFVLLAEDFTIDNDMLTPSLKLKRRNVLRKWQEHIAALYLGR